MTSNSAVTFWHPKGTIIQLKNVIDFSAKQLQFFPKKLFLLILFSFVFVFVLRTCYEKYVICNLGHSQNTDIGVQTFASKTVKFSHQWKRNLVFLSQ